MQKTNDGLRSSSRTLKIEYSGESITLDCSAALQVQEILRVDLNAAIEMIIATAELMKSLGDEYTLKLLKAQLILARNIRHNRRVKGMNI